MPAGFQQTEVAVRSSDGRFFTLLEPLVYFTLYGAVITVPAGTTTDGASTPRVLWRAIPPFGQYWLAAILHDYCYRFTDFPKETCDKLLLEAMKTLGVPDSLAEAIYLGVVHFGQTAFDEDRKQQTKVA